MKIRYFDHAATTPVSDTVLQAMLPYFQLEYGNASSMYSLGRASKKALEEARRKVANNIGANSKEIYFTSCGSESDNLAIKGTAYANKEKGNHIITSKIEHPAVLNTCKTLEKQGFEVTYLNVDEKGFIDLIAHKNNIIFHTDSVQAIGNIKINVNEYNIDLLSMSGHKFYAPKGVGALYVREGINFEKIQDGGHQEKDKRAGTENVAEIVGLGKAIEDIYQEYEKYNEKLTNLRDYYIEQIEKSNFDCKLNGDRKNRLPGNANFSFPGVNAQELLLALDEKGICASAGSACSTGNPLPSHVLTAIGLSKELANGTLRVSFGKDNTKEDVDFLIQNLREIIPSIIQKQ